MPVANQFLRSVIRHGWFTQLPDSPKPPVDTGPPPGTRDPFFQPFQSASLWNMPIGDGAVYRDAGMTGLPGGGNPNGFVPGFDGDKIVNQPTAARMPVLSSNAGWTGANRCLGTDVTRTAIPCPQTYIIGNSGANNCAAFIMTDSRTICQFQPFTHCTNGAGVAYPHATGYSFHPNEDLYGYGKDGSHGGSFLSAIGGSLRLGEVRPGDTEGPHHVLKVNVYAADCLRKSTNRSNLFRWPATQCDSYATNTSPPGYGSYGGKSISNTDMVMGSLLALHPSFAITANLTTTPARLLAWTLKYYGAYIVDDVSVAGFAFTGENGTEGNFSTQFQSDWGYPFAMHETTAHAWGSDIRTICDNFYVISNNDSAGAAPGRGVGGGGTPLQPLAPEIFPP